jgi:crotonobetainyl-CoA:carnitine CoA-transferase CaiB-like acyl-CoA transferase
MPILHGDYLRRSGVFTGALGAKRKFVFRCSDGYITCLVIGGPGGAASTRALVAWMAEKGLAADWMNTKDWVTWTPGAFMKVTDEDLEQIGDLEDRTERFFMTMDKREIYAEALKRRILLAPLANMADIADDPQLKARNFFVPVEHDTLGWTLTFPGPFAKLSETPMGATRRSPRLGEHNCDVYQELLGFGAERIAQLRAIGAI